MDNSGQKQISPQHNQYLLNRLGLDQELLIVTQTLKYPLSLHGSSIPAYLHTAGRSSGLGGLGALLQRKVSFQVIGSDVYRRL
ncbi:hypothetical protein MtrunA17_Chr1g0167941 [Medicago truncatula]|uniref:Uncharacterized protein n=1 Tax=Medicago truncatula TaxID=3880 RepID=A0A396JMM3_MEDTR|nr:hypothetical protein MtrunA17_Chr1g0167941 [Medicago truncatula]